MSNLYREANKSAKDAVAEDGRWLMGVSAIVADNQDPERQHRVRVIIPTIDEDLIFDEWARQLVFCLGDGYGSAFIPPKGSEVILFGTLGQKYNLFYASVYNEEMFMPEGYDDEMTVGVHAPGNLIFIAEQLAKIQAQNIEAIAEQVAKILAQNIEISAEQLTKVLGDNVKIEANQLAEVKGNQVKAEGSQITINGDGSISISGGNVSISGNSVTIHGRTVNKVGPPI